MNPFQDVNQGDSLAEGSGADILAIRVITHIAADEALLGRFLDLSGLTPSELRSGLTGPAVQMAALDFLAGHEPDLLACADAIGVRPDRLMAACVQLGAGA